MGFWKSPFYIGYAAIIGAVSGLTFALLLSYENRDIVVALRVVQAITWIFVFMMVALSVLVPPWRVPLYGSPNHYRFVGYRTWSERPIKEAPLVPNGAKFRQTEPSLYWPLLGGQLMVFLLLGVAISLFLRKRRGLKGAG